MSKEKLDESLIQLSQVKEKTSSILSFSFSEDFSQSIDKIKQDHIQAKLKSQMQETTGMVHSVFSIILSELGTGCLGLPYVIKIWGVVLSNVFFLMFYLLNLYTSQLLIEALTITGNTSFASISKKAFGPVGSMLVKLIIIFYSFGACLVFIIIFTSSAPELLSHFTSNEILLNRQFITTIFCLIYLTFIFLKQLKFISYAATFGVICMVVFILAIVYWLFKIIILDFPPVELWNNNDVQGMITCLPVIMYAYCYQLNFYPIIKELKSPTEERMKLAYTSGLTFTYVVYIFTAHGGYLIFKDAIKPSAMDNFKNDSSIESYIICLSMLLHIPVVLPLVFFECRNNILIVIDELIEYLNIKEKNDLPNTPIPYSSPTLQRHKSVVIIQKNKFLFYIGTSTVYILVLLMALMCPQIRTMFTFTGAVGSNSVSFILPCAFILKLRKGSLKTKLFPLFVFISGIIFMIVCISVEMNEIAD